jgi:isoleucyl-tRNA synthetase
MFEEVSGLPDQVSLEEEVLRFWEERGIFEQRRARNRGGPRFPFLDGPITANNPMGVHHAWGRTLKDAYQRYWAMRGRDQRYQNGFDCQGLWIEVETERALGFRSKRDIEAYGVAEFVDRCRERAHHFADIITGESERLGCWMDWEHSYYTDSEENNYAIWAFLKRCHQRDLVYAGTDVMPWCPRCGTGLSQQEVQEGYREVTHPGVVLALSLLDRESEFLLVWTTTPWTLTANVACAVHPEVHYARVRQGEHVYYVATARAAEVMRPDEPWRAEGELLGEELVGLRYQGPFDDLPQEREAAAHHRVLAWREVSEDEGTGIVHIAPGCGKEDYDLGQEHGLPAVAPIDDSGRFSEGAGPFAGLAAAEAAEAVIGALRERGLLYRVDEYAHRYPHCWRCGTELLFRLVDEWFIAMDPWREEIMRAAEETEWVPAYGREVELDWLRNMRDWMISKKRYWGLALPIWRCGCGWFDVIGGREELRERAAEGWPEFEGHSPHRPWVDAVKVRCARCGGLAARIPDVGNPWLDAGIVPYSTMGYFGDREEWERWFPAELVIESLPGQFRNWFYALLAMSTMMESRPPVKTVAGYGTVLDEHGEEMHKSKGNAIWFAEAAARMGADVVRWLSVSQPLTQPLRFGYGRGEEARDWMRTLWNTYSFLATYANLDGWPGTRSAPAQIGAPPLDRWLRARLASASGEVAAALESFDPPRAAGALLEVIDDLSNWWLRRSRRRFWRGGGGEEKQAAYGALHGALVTVCQLLAPFVPFTAEALYRRLAAPFADRPESVHLCDFPSAAAADGDMPLLEECALARALVGLGRAARAAAGLRVRQPLARAFVRVGAAAGGPPLPHFAQDVAEELNVKRLEFVARPEEVGEAAAAEGELAVGLDTVLTEDLVAEGVARDLVRHVQNLRKRAGLRVEDRIRLWVEGGDEVRRALAQHGEFIAAEVLAAQVGVGEPPNGVARAEVAVGGGKAALAVTRADDARGAE